VQSNWQQQMYQAAAAGCSKQGQAAVASNQGSQAVVASRARAGPLNLMEQGAEQASLGMGAHGSTKAHTG